MALTLSSQGTTAVPRSPHHLSTRKLSGPTQVQPAVAPSFPTLSQQQQNPLKSLSLPVESPIPRVRISTSQIPDPTSPLTESPQQPPSLLSGSTRTITTLVTSAFSLIRLFLNSLSSISNLAHQSNNNHLSRSVGPLFFAAIRDRPSGYLNTPLTVVAAGLAKWLDIYSGVLMVRVLLSWFPNIPWDRQPLSAIRDLCDPYLNLFRNIIPPIFDTLDVSPLLAFAVLGTLGSILHSSGGVY